MSDSELSQKCRPNTLTNHCRQSMPRQMLAALGSSEHLFKVWLKIRDVRIETSWQIFMASINHVYHVIYIRITETKKLNSVALVCKRTIPTERPPLVGEVSANFCG
jgi:hypothetical protein